MKNFENFWEDESNQMALSACRLASQKEGFSPLWICGPSGCGKTHLLKGTFDLVEENGEWAMMFSAERASEILVEHCERISLAWRLLESIPFLFIDNCEILQGKPSTQASFLELIEKKAKNGQGVFLASNCPPQELPVLSEGIKKMKNGLIADVQMPTKKLLCGAVEKYLADHPFEMTDGARERLIQKADSIPKLQGALKAAQFSFSLEKKKITARWMNRYFA